MGKSLIEEAASAAHYHWVPVVITVASIVTSGAMLRAAGRMFLGLGAAEAPYLSPEPDEGHEVGAQPTRNPVLMLVPAAALALAGTGLSLVPGLERHAEAAARRFEDTHAYVATVLQGKTQWPPVLNFDLVQLPTTSVAWGIASTSGALVLALLALYREQLFSRPAARVLHAFNVGLDPLRHVHSGAIGDYVTWLVVGVAVLGGLFAVVVR
jgi:hypothetical protein